MPRETQFSDEKQLWERYARGLPREPAECPPSIELAAWIDGHATGADAVAIETHLATCGVCRAAVVEIRQEHGALRRRLRLSDRLAPSIGVGRWGLAAAASIAICFIGYRVGSGRPTLDAVITDEVLLNEMSFGLLDSADDGLLMALEEVSR